MKMWTSNNLKPFPLCFLPCSSFQAHLEMRKLRFRETRVHKGPVQARDGYGTHRLQPARVWAQNKGGSPGSSVDIEVGP